MTRKNFYREKNFSSIKSIYFFLLFYYYICVSNFLYESRLYNVSLYTLYLERFLREDKRRKEVSTVKGFNLLVGYSEMFFSSLKITWIFQRSLERFLNCWLKKKEIFFALFSILFLTFTFQSCSQILCRSKPLGPKQHCCATSTGGLDVCSIGGLDLSGDKNTNK